MVEIAYPGETLAFIEETAGDANTIEDGDAVCAVTMGVVEKNGEKRSVGVRNARVAHYVREGDPVYGIIDTIYDQMALVRFQLVNPRVGASRTFCYIRISELSRGYARDFRDYLRVGDVIKARVKLVKETGIYLTIVDEELGVIKAFCSRDRSELSPDGVCPKCGRRHRVKWAGRREERSEEGRRFEGGRGGERRGNFRDRRGGRGRN
jgi:exosome complex component CSL4